LSHHGAEKLVRAEDLVSGVVLGEQPVEVADDLRIDSARLKAV